MERGLWISAWCAVVVLAAWFVLNSVNSPVEARRLALDRQLAGVQPENVAYDSTPRVNYDRLQDSIGGKQVIWRELVAAPPPPPPPPKVEEAPDMAKMLHGVLPSLRSKIGRGESLKIRIPNPGNLRGDFMGVGEIVNGCVIKEIRDDSVVFALEANGKTYEYVVERR